jgi:phosphatidylglycerophosphate synthase
VTLAVLCASTGNALDPTDAARLADDLTAALAAAGASVVERPSGDGTVTGQLRDIARIARASAEPLLICADNLVANPSLLWTLATEPAGRSTALVISGAGGGLREDRGRLVAAADGTVRFLGAMCIAPADLPLLAAAADHAAATGPAADGAPAAVVATDVRNAVDALLPALLDAGLVPVVTPVRLLHAERVETAAELAAATAATAAVDEDAARLRLAVKDKDDFFTTYAVSSWSPVITKWCARLGLTPTGVTGLSLLFALAAALAFWQASRPAMIAGAVLLYLGFVLDCVDGQLARYTRRFGVFGGWLDTMADRAKEYAVYAGLAAGAERVGLPYAWPLAITAILLQTVRHMTDAWYGALHDRAAALPHATPATGVGARLSAASNRVQADTGSAAYWLKRIVVFPIGERWALIAVLAATVNGRVALAAVVIWGLLAAAYTLGLRSLRSASMRVGVLDTVDTSRHRDDGPLVRAVLSRAGLPAPLAFALVAVLAALAVVVWLLVGGASHAKPVLVVAAALVLSAGLPARARHGRPLDWLVPGALRAAEYLFVVAVGLIGSVPPPVVFGLLFALALRHYDLVARMEKGAPAGSGTRAVLGWDGRVVVVTVAALAGVATLGEAMLAVAVGGVFLIAAIADWRREGSAR